MRLDWKSVLGLVVTLGLLWWLFREEDPVEIWNHIREADFLLLALAVTIATVGFAIRAMRWRVFLAPLQANPPFGSRFRAVCIGFMCNNLLPARVGELARAYAYGRLEGIPATAALGTLVVERVLDGVAILGLFLFAIMSPSFPADALPPPVLAGVRVVALSVGGLLVVLTGLILAPSFSQRVVRGLSRRLLPERWGRAVVGMAGAFLEGLSSLRSPRLLFLGLAWSVGFWMFHSVSFWVGLMAFGIDLPYAAALFLNGTVAIAVSAPAAPGYFGTFHVAVKVALVDVYRVAAGPALGFAFGYHLGGFIPITALGLWYAREMGLSLGDVAKSPAGDAP